MTVHDGDRLIRAFLEEGQTDLPERAYAAIRHGIDRTRQRPAWPWFDLRPRTALKLAVSVAVLLAVIVATFSLIQPPKIQGPGTSSSPSGGPTPVLLPTTGGRIDPGTYVTNPADPVVPLPITLTLPEGWNDGGWALTKNGNYISFWTVTNTYTDPCRWSTTALDPPLGPSVDDLVVALQQQAGRNTGAPTPATVGGHAGQRIELDWPADVRPETCDGGEYRLWIFGDNAPRGNTMGVHSTIWIVDVNGLRVAIEADSQPNTKAEQLVEVQAIIRSISFGVPGA